MHKWGLKARAGSSWDVSKTFSKNKLTRLLFPAVNEMNWGCTRASFFNFRISWVAYLQKGAANNYPLV